MEGTAAELYAKALDFLSRGHRKDAADILFQLYPLTKNNLFKLQVIDALLNSIDILNEPKKLIQLSEEGITLASQLKHYDFMVHLMAKKIHFLESYLIPLQHEQGNLKLSPDWVGFSTERDKISYQTLTEEIDRKKKEIDNLISDSIYLAKQIGSKRALATALMSEASVESSRFLHYRVEALTGGWKSKLIVKFLQWGIEIPIIFGIKYFINRSNHIKSLIQKYTRAAGLFEQEIEQDAVIAYFNLAVALHTMGEFRRASKFLKKAKILAKKNNLQLDLEKIRMLEKSIKARNKDVPNYLEGERRQEITV